LSLVGLLYILFYMKQILVELDDQMAESLERVAPARSRRRSEFVRAAIRKAIWEEEERETAEAYRRHPDSADDALPDPRVWDPANRYRPRGRKRS